MMPTTLMSVATVSITEEMLEPVVEQLISHIGVILPIGVTIFGIIVGIAMVPKILRMFTTA